MRNILNKIGLRHLSMSLRHQSDVVGYYSAKWNLINLKPLDTLDASNNHIFEGLRKSDASRVILKMHHSLAEATAETTALKFYDGNGCVKLFKTDPAHGVLLRSFAFSPSLATMFPKQDDTAASAAVEVIRKLHSKSLNDSITLPTTQDLLLSLKSNNEIPELHIEKAKSMAKSLHNKSPQVKVLLHGDLHHSNILSDGKGEWIAIDPKGVIGDPAYEAGAFIRNPMPQIIADKYNFHKIFSKRLEIFAQGLSLEKADIASWSYVQSVLSACWAVEDKQEAGVWIECAKLIGEISAKENYELD